MVRMNAAFVGERQAKKGLRGTLQGTLAAFNMPLTQMIKTFNTQFSRGVEASHRSMREIYQASFEHEDAAPSIPLTWQESHTQEGKPEDSS